MTGSSGLCVCVCALPCGRVGFSIYVPRATVKVCSGMCFLCKKNKVVSKWFKYVFFLNVSLSCSCPKNVWSKVQVKRVHPLLLASMSHIWLMVEWFTHWLQAWIHQAAWILLKGYRVHWFILIHILMLEKSQSGWKNHQWWMNIHVV